MVVLLLLLVLLALLIVLAMRVFAWAGRKGPEEPTAVMMSRMPQASATHADQVRTRMVPSLSFQG
jgi:flagellar basal body-associated protein FliL